MKVIRLYNLTPQTSYKLQINKTMNWKALWEAVKLPLRLLVLSIIPVLITYVASLPAQWAGFLTTILVILDKYLHEAEVAKPVKEQNEGVGGVRGLTGF